MKTIRPMLHSCVPAQLRCAVQALAKDAKMTVSAWIRECVIEECARRMPGLRERATTELITPKLATLRLLSTIRRGITSDSAAGRLKNRHQRAAYMNYCHRCVRSGANRLDFITWSAQNTVLPPKLDHSPGVGNMVRPPNQ